MVVQRMRPRALLSVVLAASLLAACSGSTSTPTAAPPASVPPTLSATPSPASVPATLSATTPPAGGPASSPVASGLPTPVPSLALFDPTRTLDPSAQQWPTSVIDAAIALAVLDNGIKQAGADLTTAAQQEDMVLFLGAATGLARIVEQAMVSAQRLADFEATKQVGESYLPVLTSLDTAASSLAAALRTGDGAGVQSSMVSLGATLDGYLGVREGMVVVADQALLMQRGLLR